MLKSVDALSTDVPIAVIAVSVMAATMRQHSDRGRMINGRSGMGAGSAGGS